MKETDVADAPIPLIKKKKRSRGNAQQKLMRASEAIPVREGVAKSGEQEVEEEEQVASSLKRARIMGGTAAILSTTKRANAAATVGDEYIANRERRNVSGGDDQGATAENRLELERLEAMQTEGKLKKGGSKLVAGPVKGSSNVRISGQFDYQPDICKDFYETGYCGYGWNCKFAHIREEHKTGYQVEKEWDEEQRRKKLGLDKVEIDEEDNKRRKVGEGELAIDVDAEGIPFACYLCRKSFTDPVVTQCKHYFCEKCILTNYRSGRRPTCPICQEPTNGIFNTPSRDVMRKLMRKTPSAPQKKRANGEEDEEKEQMNRELRDAFDTNRESSISNPPIK